MILALLVGLGASFGAVARYVLDQAVTRRRGSTFPAGTWLINITGSFILGLLTGLSAHHGLSDHVVTVIGTGVCGGYTTFSTFSYETVRLTEEGTGLVAVGNVVGSIAAGLAAAALGLGLALL
jgi:fluoride exporter